MITPTNEQLKELKTLENIAKFVDARITELKKLCKDRGSFATDSYVVAVVTQQRTALAPLEVVVAALGREILTRNELIKTSEFQVVKVSELKDRPQANPTL